MQKEDNRCTYVETTIPHEIVGHFGAGRVFLKPASKGTVYCRWTSPCCVGGSRVPDILTKSLGSSNPHNMVQATVDGLRSLKKAEVVAAMRENHRRAIRLELVAAPY